MGAVRSLTLHPGLASAGRLQAGGKAFAIPPAARRPDASGKVFQIMLSLLETLRNQAVSGHEPGSYLLTVLPGGGLRICADKESASWEPALLSFRVAARSSPEGRWLKVEETTGRAGWRLEQFCRKLSGGGWEALPYCWSRPDAF